VGDVAAGDKFFKFSVGVVFVALFSKMFFVVDVEIDDDLGGRGETEHQSIALQALFVTPIFPEIISETIFVAIGVFGNNFLIRLADAVSQFHDFVLLKFFWGEFFFERFDLFF